MTQDPAEREKTPQPATTPQAPEPQRRPIKIPLEPDYSTRNEDPDVDKRETT